MIFTAGWAWLVLTVGVVLYVVAFDLWAYYTQTTMMTVEFRSWLFNPVTGPFIFAGWVGLFVGLTYHWFLKRGQS
jgi:hypothetical protein